MNYFTEEEPRSTLPKDLDQALRRFFPDDTAGEGRSLYRSREAWEAITRVLPHVDDASDMVEGRVPLRRTAQSRDAVLTAARMMAAAGRYLNNAPQHPSRWSGPAPSATSSGNLMTSTPARSLRPEG